MDFIKSLIDSIYWEIKLWIALWKDRRKNRDQDDNDNDKFIY